MLVVGWWLLPSLIHLFLWFQRSLMARMLSAASRPNAITVIWIRLDPWNPSTRCAGASIGGDVARVSLAHLPRGAGAQALPAWSSTPRSCNDPVDIRHIGGGVAADAFNDRGRWLVAWTVLIGIACSLAIAASCWSRSAVCSSGCEIAKPPAAREVASPSQAEASEIDEAVVAGLTAGVGHGCAPTFCVLSVGCCAGEICW